MSACLPLVAVLVAICPAQAQQAPADTIPAERQAALKAAVRKQLQNWQQASDHEMTVGPLVPGITKITVQRGQERDPMPDPDFFYANSKNRVFDGLATALTSLKRPPADQQDALALAVLLASEAESPSTIVTDSATLAKVPAALAQKYAVALPVVTRTADGYDISTFAFQETRHGGTHQLHRDQRLARCRITIAKTQYRYAVEELRGAGDALLE